MNWYTSAKTRLKHGISAKKLRRGGAKENESMRLAACEKVPPMIRSTSEARRSSSQSRHQPSSASSDRQQRKRLHGAGSSSSPASLDVMRLSKRFHPQSSHSERSPDYAHRQVKKKGREGDYLHEITLLEFTPEKSPHLHEGGLGEDEEGGEVEVAFFDEGQECSASGTPIMNKKSPSSLIAPSRRRQNSKRRERAQLNTPQSREDRGEDEEASPYFTFQEELTLKSATSAATPPNVPMNYSLTSSSPTKLNLADVSPNQLIEICKSLIASDVFSASCTETLQLLLASKYDWIIPQARLGELETALAWVAKEGVTNNLDDGDDNAHNLDNWMRVDNSAQCIRERWGLFGAK